MITKVRPKKKDPSNLWLPDHVFLQCERAFVFSSVDVIVVSEGSFLLGLRRIEPGKGTWALPGGIVRRGELREDAVYRITKLDTGLDVSITHFLGVYDHLWPTRQYIVNCYVTTIKSGNTSNLPNLQTELTNLRFFDTIPDNTHPNYTCMLEDAGWRR